MRDRVGGHTSDGAGGLMLAEAQMIRGVEELVDIGVIQEHTARTPDARPQHLPNTAVFIRAGDCSGSLPHTAPQSDIHVLQMHAGPGLPGQSSRLID